jgi:hypothetical protein
VNNLRWGTTFLIETISNSGQNLNKKKLGSF